MIENYFNMKTKVRKLKARYKELTIEEKIDLMSLELKLEGKDIKAIHCHTKAEKKALKRKKAQIRRHNAKYKIQSR